MRKTVLLAATFGVGVIGLGTNGYGQDMGPTVAGEKTEQRLYRPGAPTTQEAFAPDAAAIREVLREATDATITKGGFDDLIERFSKADRERLAKDAFSEKNHPTLDGRIAQIQKDWQAKYNQQFKITDKNAVFDGAFTAIVQGRGENPRLASERQMPADKQTATERDTARDAATVTFAASHGLPEVRVPLVKEGMTGRWKIDVPDNYSAEQLHENLLKYLTMVGEHKDQWPADANEAYRYVSHHVFAAVMNADTQMGSEQRPAAMPDNRPTDRQDTAPFPKPNENPNP